MRAAIATVLLAVMCAPVRESLATAETNMLPPPGFHHLHLNSVDPAAAIDFYTKQFASTSASSWGGLPALASPNNVLLLFGKVATPPATTPQSAIWHFGWHVTDVRKSLGTYKSRPDVKLLPGVLIKAHISFEVFFNFLKLFMIIFFFIFIYFI